MNKETIDLLNALAAKLGTTADHLWAVLIRQAYTSIWIDFTMYAITALLIWTSINRVPGWIAQIINWDDEDDLAGIRCLIQSSLVLFCTLILTLATITCISDTITEIMNPEYWALQKIMEVVKK